jgi:hypothetical protein
VHVLHSFVVNSHVGTETLKNLMTEIISRKMKNYGFSYSKLFLTENGVSAVRDGERSNERIFRKKKTSAFHWFELFQISTPCSSQ